MVDPTLLEARLKQPGHRRLWGFGVSRPLAEPIPWKSPGLPGSLPQPPIHHASLGPRHRRCYDAGSFPPLGGPERMPLKNKKAAPAKPASGRKAIKIAEPPVRAPHSEAYETALTAYGVALDLLRKKDFAAALPRFRTVE